MASGRIEQAVQRRRNWWEGGGEGPTPSVEAAAGMSGGWGDHITAAAPPVHLLEQPGAVGAAGWGQVEVPATASLGERPVQAQVVVGGQAAQRGPADWAVDVQDVGEFPGDQADVGVRPAPPPPGQLARVASGAL
jgi:hypothetical protein